VERFERSAPNELWQMDFKGSKLWYQKVGPLSVIDDHSRYVIVLKAVASTHTEQVREPLVAAFCEHGVPEAMLMDHGTPWWSVHSAGGMTKLSLWLMRQGIGLHWSRVRHPQTPGQSRAVSRRVAASAGAAASAGTGTYNCGWISFAGSTITCGPMRRWACRLRPAAGFRVRGAMMPTRRVGNIRWERGC